MDPWFIQPHGEPPQVNGPPRWGLALLLAGACLLVVAAIMLRGFFVP